MPSRAKAQPESRSSASAPTSDIAADAYIFGYPLVIMDVTRRLATGVARPETGRAPINQFVHMRAFPDASFTDVVSPNADSLYSAAWLDLSAEPIVLSVPDMERRYYLMPLLDAWTNVFASPGTRTTGNAKGAFAIVGPKWSGTLPAGLPTIKSPTNIAWLIGRTQADGKQDFAAVHAIQDQYALTPLSAWETPYRAPTDVIVDPSVDTKTPPVAQVANMDAAGFFRRMNALMIGNPPSTADAPALARFESLGVGPGKALDANGLDPVLDDGVKLARARLEAETKRPRGTQLNGWDIQPSSIGRYGTDYVQRAVVAVVGLGANLPDDAVYPHATADSTGRPLDGASKYVIRFGRGVLPPVRAFWSITMYNAKQSFVDNPIDRYAIGDRDTLAFGDDESLTLYVQHDSPGKDKEANWLPAPTDSFNLIMRLYWPTQAILGATWQPPPVERVP